MERSQVNGHALLPWIRTAAQGLLLFLGACATYTGRTSVAFNDFRRGHFSQSIRAYSDPGTTGAPFLQWAEAGTVALAGGQWKQAEECLSRASRVVQDLEREALVSPESAAESLLTWTINESFSDYMGEGYERVLLHDALALAYLGLGKPDDSRVELRQADALLVSEQTLYSKEYAAGGLAHFLSAVLYELGGRPDEAYIDYQRMEQKGIGAELFGPALVRLARALDDDEGLARWRERFGPPAGDSADRASVVVIAGVGLGPYKEENTLTLPTGDGLLQWSVPSYCRRSQPISSLFVSVGGHAGSVSTVVIEDVASVARENLEDRLAWLAAKSTFRAFLKRAISDELERDHGLGGAILGALFTLATERADLRSWQTLPDTWQAARVFVPPGIHELLVSTGARTAALGTFRLAAGETMFVIARTIDEDLRAYPIGGELIEAGKP